MLGYGRWGEIWVLVSKQVLCEELQEVREENLRIFVNRTSVHSHSAYHWCIWHPIFFDKVAWKWLKIETMDCKDIRSWNYRYATSCDACVRCLLHFLRDFATMSSDVICSYRIVFMKFLSCYICYHISIFKALNLHILASMLFCLAHKCTSELFAHSILARQMHRRSRA